MPNWGGMFKGLGEGMDDLRDAKEKTMEMEYRNMRDANLRRYEVEDRDLKNQREDVHRGEDRANTVADQDRALIEKDEAAGIGETPRAKSYQERERQKHQDAIDLIEKRNEAYRSMYGKGKMTKQAFIDKALEQLRKVYMDLADPDIPGSGDIPPEVYEDALKRFSNQYESFAKITGGEVTPGYTPFDITTDPADLRSLIPSPDEEE